MTFSISRRSLLGRTAGAALIGAAAPAIAKATVLPRTILVLGAGMAGLTAALALLRRGHDVTVIEHQNRVGGRLWSVPLQDGQFSEAGGGHFRSNMPYVLSYLRHFDLPLLGLNDGLPRYMFDGRCADAADLADRPWALAPAERGVTVTSMLNAYLYRVGLDTDTVLDSRWPDPEALARLDRITLGDLIRSAGASDGFCKLLNAHAGTFTTDGQALSMIPRLAYHFGDKNLFRVQGGNDRLPRALAAAIGPERIVLDAPVVAIDQSGSRVTVSVRDGRSFTADAVISTIPFSVLPKVAVQPAWSAAKQRLFSEMEWGNTVKVIVQTERPGWLARNVHGWPMAGGDRGWERVIDITGNEAGGRGNVFFYLNGGNATSVLRQPAAERAAFVLDQFRSDMPDLLGRVVMQSSFAWTEQPWIGGSFGEPPLGGGWMVGEWATPEDRIHFAGDFTTLKSGWVEGAIESGLRAARQIDPAAAPEGQPKIRQEL